MVQGWGCTTCRGGCTWCRGVLHIMQGCIQCRGAPHAGVRDAIKRASPCPRIPNYKAANLQIFQALINDALLQGAFFSDHRNGRVALALIVCVVAKGNAEALSVVSSRYQIVQPHEVLEFFRDLVGAGGFTINTAGALRGGRRIWALAEVGEKARVVGDDIIRGYLLLATSCDGGLATTARFTSVRVVCANTLAMAERDAKKHISIPHSTKFDPAAVKAAIGIATNSFEEFMVRARLLADKPVSVQTAEDFIAKLLTRRGEAEAKYDVRASRGFASVMDLFNGAGIGAEMDGSRGTAWGLVNAVTEYIDHRKQTTGIIPDVDSVTQKRFDQGHEAESRARPLAEQIVGEELYPVVGVNGKYSASFDGITFDETMCFEHKYLNNDLMQVKTADDLHEQYRAQMEHQLMVSEKLERQNRCVNRRTASRAANAGADAQPDNH